MQSEQINELATALALAQGEIEGAVKDSANPYFKSKYADLHAVKEACREPLAKNGLSVVQPTIMIDGKICLCTILMHKSGQWIKGITPLVYAKSDAQAIGSAMTYFRRYAFCSMIGVSQFDDDGEQAMNRNEKASNSNINTPTFNDLHTALVTILGEDKCSNLSKFLRSFSKKIKAPEAAIISSAVGSEGQLNKFRINFEEWLEKNKQLS